MIMIACVDKKNGMMFNGRRQSQDREVLKKMFEYAEGRFLWMSKYSAQLFREEQQRKIKITESFLDLNEDDICFIEESIPEGCGKQIRKIILFRWQRIYPADFYFNFDLRNFCLTGVQILEGSSHKEIVIEIYEQFLNGGIHEKENKVI